jgi:ketosteroid isomerase-like protein
LPWSPKLTQIEAKAATFKSVICLMTVLAVSMGAVHQAHPAGASTPASQSSLVERLAARQEIEELFAQYGASLDRRDFDAFGRLFTEDAVYGSGSTPTRGRAAIQSQLQQTITANPSHLPGPDFHLYFNPSIHVDGDHATAHSMGAYLIPDDRSPGGWKLIFLVSYDDTLVRQNGRWLFQQRMLHPAAAPAKG